MGEKEGKIKVKKAKDDFNYILTREREKRIMRMAINLFDLLLPRMKLYFYTTPPPPPPPSKKKVTKTSHMRTSDCPVGGHAVMVPFTCQQQVLTSQNWTLPRKTLKRGPRIDI